MGDTWKPVNHHLTVFIFLKNSHLSAQECKLLKFNTRKEHSHECTPTRMLRILSLTSLIDLREHELMNRDTQRRDRTKMYTKAAAA